MNIPPRPMNQTWSGDDCIDVTLIWLRHQREKVDYAIRSIEAVKNQGAFNGKGISDRFNNLEFPMLVNDVVGMREQNRVADDSATDAGYGDLHESGASCDGSRA